VSTSTTNATGLAGRYATALFDLADSDGALDQVADDLTNLDGMIDDSDDLQRLIRSPVIARDDQSRGIIALMERAEMSNLAQRFVGLVARNRRLFALPDMIAAYRSLLAAHRGEATAEVVSAQELSDKQLEAVGDALRRAVGTPVSVDARVDPSLLGGLVVKLGSRMVDSSLSTKLQRLRLAMIGVG
jgi:F-type H+-transporting ATPase subunit delta